MLVLGAEDDIGFALLIFVLFMAMLWLTSGRWNYVALGLVLFVAGAVAADRLFTQVNVRVADWLHPVPTSQIMLGLYGMGTGGLTGTGLGFGHISAIIPEVLSDYIFAAFGTEMGLLGTTAIVFAFVLLVGAGMRIAQTARSEFAQMVAAGLTVILGFQALFIMAGIVRLLPLTGITLPFMAYGGSSLVANYVLIALLMRISDEGERAIVAEQATAMRVRRSVHRGGAGPHPLTRLRHHQRARRRTAVLGCAQAEVSAVPAGGRSGRRPADSGGASAPVNTQSATRIGVGSR